VGRKRGRERAERADMVQKGGGLGSDICPWAASF